MTKASFSSFSLSLSGRIWGVLPFLLLSFLFLGCGRVPCRTTAECKKALGSDFICVRRHCVSPEEGETEGESWIEINSEALDPEEEETSEEEGSEGGSDDKSKD